jgi:hypothetical protein
MERVDYMLTNIGPIKVSVIRGHGTYQQRLFFIPKLKTSPPRYILISNQSSCEFTSRLWKFQINFSSAAVCIVIWSLENGV